MSRSLLFFLFFRYGRLDQPEVDNPLCDIAQRPGLVNIGQEAGFVRQQAVDHAENQCHGQDQQGPAGQLGLITEQLDEDGDYAVNPRNHRYDQDKKRADSSHI